MKYIISENRLSEFINSYLESFLSTKAISHSDPWIIISQAAQGDDEIWADYMEHDHTDGRLWVNKVFLRDFMDLFGFRDKESALSFIKNWFENKFEVEVKFVET